MRWRRSARNDPRRRKKIRFPARTSYETGKEEIADQPVIPKENDGKAEQIQFDKKRFIWPVKGKVVSQFGIQPNRMYYNGIRIAAGEGTAVQAAADGLVIFSARSRIMGRRSSSSMRITTRRFTPIWGSEPSGGKAGSRRETGLRFSARLMIRRNPISISRSVTGTRRAIPSFFFPDEEDDRQLSGNEVEGKISTQDTNRKSY